MTARVAPAEDSANMIDVKLLKDEGGGLMMEAGIATLTFYKGSFSQTQKTSVLSLHGW